MGWRNVHAILSKDKAAYSDLKFSNMYVHIEEKG